MKISQQQLADFQRDGYLILDIKLKRGLLDRVIAGIEGHYERTEGDGNYAHGTRVQDAWCFDAGVRSIALDKHILRSLHQLFGRKPRPFQTLNFPVGTEQRTHSDTIHFNSKPSGFMAGAWVALEDVDEDNGALAYYPGNH